MKRKIGCYVYDRMADWEICIALSQIPGEYAGRENVIVPFSENGKTVVGLSGLKYSTGVSVEEMAVLDGIDGIIIPGGNDRRCPESLAALLREIHQQKKMLAAICGAPEFLARAGVLAGKKYTTSLDAKAFCGQNDPFHWEDKKEESLVIDANVITAKPEGYVEFGIACADFLGRYAAGESSEARKWFRGLTWNYSLTEAKAAW